MQVFFFLHTALTEHEELRKKYKALDAKFKQSERERNELNNKLRLTIQDFENLKYGKF